MKLRPGHSPPDPEEFRPGDLGPVGAQLWTDVVAGWRDLDLLQLVILRNVAHTADIVDRLERELGAEEIVAPDGPRRLVIDELHEQRAVLVEMLDAIGLPEDGPRVVRSEAGEMARRSARMRWATVNDPD